jgi:pimeloyl-ACP methyl ester carboxylesterase
LQSVPGPTDEDYGSPRRSAWRAIDWRAHQRWLTLDGQAVNVVELGAGPAVLLVHGHDGSWQNWLETIPHLAERHRVIALDLPGFGASPPPSGEVSIPRYAGVLAELCDALGVVRADVVGSSMGGLIAAELAIREPRRVERLVLVSAAGLSRRYNRIPLRILAHAQAPLRALARAQRAWSDRARFVAGRPRLRRAALFAAVRHPERIAPDIAAFVVRASGRPAGVAAARAVARHDIGARLGEIHVPTLIVWGADDAVIAAEAGERFAALIAGARLVVVPDTGHVPMLERPAHFNALLDEFLG